MVRGQKVGSQRASLTQAGTKEVSDLGSPGSAESRKSLEEGALQVSLIRGEISDD